MWTLGTEPVIEKEKSGSFKYIIHSCVHPVVINQQKTAGNVLCGKYILFQYPVA